MRINVPDKVKNILLALEYKGYQAYIVGGCVRDALIGKTPHDWDITTDATPEQMMFALSDYHIIETGLKHGTITVDMSGDMFEVTTFRIDGQYSDNRRPDEVFFTHSVKEDLSRRDFTINAMAYGEDGIVDPFEGQKDLNSNIIRCVGDPDQRFNEDGLRILRALRFASTLGFKIEKRTGEAILRNKDLLKNISSERVFSELTKLMQGTTPAKVMREYAEVIFVVIPELAASYNFKQNNPYHNLDVWNHVIESVELSDNETVLRWTMLLHDIAKPMCYSEVRGVGHFYTHPEIGAEMTETILRRLHCDNATIKSVTLLIEEHDRDLAATRHSVTRLLNKYSYDFVKNLIKVKRADTMAQSPKKFKQRWNLIDKVEILMERIIQEGDCFSLKDLSISGEDIISLGVPEGKEIGTILKDLLDMVIDGYTKNTREDLLKEARILAKDYVG